ncbi:MAG: FAD-binding oxidoreductase [Saprospiraceae bacterium]|nr:FAD-binding oxidoreductase [Saprospiraceae bacterium]
MINHSSSYWELSTYQANSDFLIIGAGITGINAAITLKSMSPSARVVVLDKGSWGDGASFRNAGFACLGSPTELLADMQEDGIEAVMSIVQMRWNGLQRLVSRVGAPAMELVWCGGTEFFPSTHKDAWEKVGDHLSQLNKQFASLIQGEQFVCDVPDPGFRQGVGQVRIKTEGRLHPGKMMHHLHQLARGLGVDIIGGQAVTGWERTGSLIQIRTQGGQTFHTHRMGMATNGFTPHLVADLDVVPARNQVFLTEEIPDLSWDHTLHVDQGYIYARRIGQRLLIGGGRNLDPLGEKTDEPGTTKQIEAYLLAFVREHLPVAQNIRFDSCWSGTLGVGTKKLPILRELEENIFAAVRLGGMGVAIGTLVGDDLAHLMLSA